MLVVGVDLGVAVGMVTAVPVLVLVAAVAVAHLGLKRLVLETGHVPTATISVLLASMVIFMRIKLYNELPCCQMLIKALQVLLVCWFAHNTIRTHRLFSSLTEWCCLTC